MKRKLITTVLLLPCLASALQAADAADDFSLRPNIHGALRARYEMATGNGHAGEERFQVRNARLSIDGRVAPSIAYFIQTDLCDRGKMKILDAWGRLALSTKFDVQAGQFRLPFGTDVYRAPSNYVFSNRSFLGKNMCNYRGVGARLGWHPSKLLSIEAGAFNPTSMGDHEVWVRDLAYSGRVVLTHSGFTLATGAQSLLPDGTRCNLTGASLGWTGGRWQFEGEWMMKHYCHSDLSDAHAWVCWANYTMPAHIGVFNQASVQGRVDGLTDHSNGVHNADGLLTVTDPARTRLTLGGTLTYSYRNVHADLRLSYEAYFYRHDLTPASATDASKVCAEMIIRF